jgi:hypothetical protein
MPDNVSARHQLPYLVVAQAQKELTHNEALARIDALLHPVVQARLSSAPNPAVTDAGKCWLVDAAAVGEWQGKTNSIAVWAGGSWRYVAPVPAMRIRNMATGTDLLWTGAAWIAAPTIADPQSGSVIDIQARAAIAALLSYFRSIGQFTP